MTWNQKCQAWPLVSIFMMFSSFFLQEHKVLHLLRCPYRSVWFSNQASRKRLQFNSLSSEKLQSALAKDTDEGKDFIKTFVFFLHSPSLRALIRHTERKSNSLLSRVQLFVTLWTVPARLLCPWHFSGRKYWSRLPTLGDLLAPGVKPLSLVSPALAGGFFIRKEGFHCFSLKVNW